MLATIGIGLRTNPEDVPQSNRHAKLLHQHLPSRRAALRSAIQTRRNKQIARKSATHQRPIVRDHSLFRTQRTNQSTREKKKKKPACSPSTTQPSGARVGGGIARIQDEGGLLT